MVANRIQLFAQDPIKVGVLGTLLHKKTNAVRIDEIIASCGSAYVGWSEYPVKTRAAADCDLYLGG